MPTPVKSEKLAEEVPAGLKVFHFHKVDNLKWSNEKNASADCPFCGKANKLAINKLSSQYQCFVCGEKGNELTFVRKIWEMSLEVTKTKDYELLCADSKFFDVQVPREWGVAKHILTNEWCVPGFNHEKIVTGLYRFVNLKKDDKWNKRLLPSPNLGHHLFGAHLYEEQKAVNYLCEGWRDAIKLYEVLKNSSPHGAPLLNDINVLATPGTNSFRLEWARYFNKKHNVVMFDNDYPLINPKTQQETFSGGRAGVARVASIIKKDSESLQYICWGGRRGNKGYTTDLPDGTDIRDFLTTNNA